MALVFVLSTQANAFVLVAAALLLARSFYGLQLAPRITPAKVIGFQEMGFGLAYVVLLALAIV